MLVETTGAFFERQCTVDALSNTVSLLFCLLLRLFQFNFTEYCCSSSCNQW